MDSTDDAREAAVGASANRDSSDGAADRVLVYADYVCPFCYLGRTSLDRYAASREDPLEIEWHPFDLRHGKRTADGEIDHGVDDGKDDAYFERARENVRRLQERYDVEMAREIATDVDSLNAQLVSWYVSEEDPERWRTFDGAVYDALWVDGRDVGDPNVLREVAADVGVPTEAVETALEDNDRRARLEERFEEARRRGVTGVPTFVSDGQAARGAVPPEHLRRLVEGES